MRKKASYWLTETDAKRKKNNIERRRNMFTYTYTERTPAAQTMMANGTCIKAGRFCVVEFVRRRRRRGDMRRDGRGARALFPFHARTTGSA